MNLRATFSTSDYQWWRGAAGYTPVFSSLSSLSSSGSSSCRVIWKVLVSCPASPGLRFSITVWLLMRPPSRISCSGSEEESVEPDLTSSSSFRMEQSV